MLLQFAAAGDRGLPHRRKGGHEVVEFIGRVSVGSEAKAGVRKGPPLATVADVLAEADDRGYVRLHFSPGQWRDLAKLQRIEGLASRVVDEGYVEIDVNHLRELPLETPVRIGYEVNYTPEEAELLDP